MADRHKERAEGLQRMKEAAQMRKAQKSRETEQSRINEAAVAAISDLVRFHTTDAERDLILVEIIARKTINNVVRDLEEFFLREDD